MDPINSAFPLATALNARPTADYIRNVRIWQLETKINREKLARINGDVRTRPLAAMRESTARAILGMKVFEFTTRKRQQSLARRTPYLRTLFPALPDEMKRMSAEEIAAEIKNSKRLMRRKNVRESPLETARLMSRIEELEAASIWPERADQLRLEQIARSRVEVRFSYLKMGPDGAWRKAGFEATVLLPQQWKFVDGQAVPINRMPRDLLPRVENGRLVTMLSRVANSRVSVDGVEYDAPFTHTSVGPVKERGVVTDMNLYANFKDFAWEVGGYLPENNAMLGNLRRIAADYPEDPVLLLGVRVVGEQANVGRDDAVRLLEQIQIRTTGAEQIMEFATDYVRNAVSKGIAPDQCFVHLIIDTFRDGIEREHLNKKSELGRAMGPAGFTYEYVHRFIADKPGHALDDVKGFFEHHGLGLCVFDPIGRIVRRIDAARVECGKLARANRDITSTLYCTMRGGHVTRLPEEIGRRRLECGDEIRSLIPSVYFPLKSGSKSPNEMMTLDEVKAIVVNACEPAERDNDNEHTLRDRLSEIRRKLDVLSKNHKKSDKLAKEKADLREEEARLKTEVKSAAKKRSDLATKWRSRSDLDASRRSRSDLATKWRSHSDLPIERRIHMNSASDLTELAVWLSRRSVPTRVGGPDTMITSVQFDIHIRQDHPVIAAKRPDAMASAPTPVSMHISTYIGATGSVQFSNIGERVKYTDEMALWKGKFLTRKIMSTYGHGISRLLSRAERPMTGRIAELATCGRIWCVDHKKYYSWILSRMKTVPVMTPFDLPIKVTDGAKIEPQPNYFYVVRGAGIGAREQLVSGIDLIDKSTSSTVLWIIPTTDVEWPAYELMKEMWSEERQKTIGVATLKSISNSVIGYFGKTKSVKSKPTLYSDREEAHLMKCVYGGHVTEYGSDNIGGKPVVIADQINSVGETEAGDRPCYVHNVSREARLVNGYLPIQMQIYARARHHLRELEKKLEGAGATVVAYKTDACYVQCSEEVIRAFERDNPDLFGMDELEFKNFGKLTITEVSADKVPGFPSTLGEQFSRPISLDCALWDRDIREQPILAPIWADGKSIVVSGFTAEFADEIDEPLNFLNKCVSSMPDRPPITDTRQQSDLDAVLAEPACEALRRLRSNLRADTNTAILISGACPGVGKTSLMRKFCINRGLSEETLSSYLFVYPQHVQARKSAAVLSAETGIPLKKLDERFVTYDKLFGCVVGIEKEDERVRLTGVSVVVFDEIFQESIRILQRIPGLMEDNPSTIFLAAGDPFQCAPIDDINWRPNYLEYAIRMMFPRCILLKQNKRMIESERTAYAAFYEKIRKAETPGERIALCKEMGIKTTTEVTDSVGLCYYNVTCEHVRSVIKRNGWTAGGMAQRVLCKRPTRKNAAANATFMNMDYGVLAVRQQDGQIAVRSPQSGQQQNAYLLTSDGREGVPCTQDFLNRNFVSAAAMTVHSVQGASLSIPYVIYDIENGDARWFNTAISRTTNLANVTLYVGEPLATFYTDAELQAVVIAGSGAPASEEVLNGIRGQMNRLRRCCRCGGSVVLGGVRYEPNVGLVCC